MATFILPGGWHGGWAYDPVAARLRRLGHTVHALTLPGLSDDSADGSDVNLDTHVDCVVQAVTAVDPRCRPAGGAVRAQLRRLCHHGGRRSCS